MYKGLPGGSENIFREGIDVSQRRGVLLRIRPKAVGSEGYSSLLGTALHSGIAGS